jgi:hypothetical protein
MSTVQVVRTGAKSAPVLAGGKGADFAHFEVDLCPICGAAGQEFCTEEDGQAVLPHWGREPSGDSPEGTAEVAAAA